MALFVLGMGTLSVAAQRLANKHFFHWLYQVRMAPVGWFLAGSSLAFSILEEGGWIARLVGFSVLSAAYLLLLGTIAWQLLKAKRLASGPDDSPGARPDGPLHQARPREPAYSTHSPALSAWEDETNAWEREIRL